MNNPLYAILGIGNSGGDASQRLVNRREFLPCGGGWMSILTSRIIPLIGLGFTNIVIANPAGEVPGFQQAEAWIEARKAGLSLLADIPAFVTAMQIARSKGANLLCYMGGVLNSTYIRQGKDHRQRLRRAMECYKPVFDADVGLVLDGDAAVHPNSDASEIIDALAECRPNPDRPQMLEALCDSSWGTDRPVVVRDSTYRTGSKRPAKGQDCYRIIDNAGGTGAMVNSPEWWRTVGPQQVALIRADGHGVWVNSDPFVDSGMSASVLEVAT